MSYIRSQILVCGGTGCHSNKSNVLIEELKKEIKTQRIGR
jgi:NADH:ubiquinone oxidoreductase subunit E